MKDTYEISAGRIMTDVNANRKRITIDKDGKPVKIIDSAEGSANNFKPSQLKLERKPLASFDSMMTN